MPRRSKAKGTAPPSIPTGGMLMSQIPDFREDISKWNAAWEAQFPFFDTIFGNLEVAVLALESLPPQSLFPAEKSLECDYRLIRKLRALQEEMHVLAVTSVLQPDFPWKTLTPAAREEHLLEGLLRTNLDDADGQYQRMFTSDIILSSLAADGENFLSLVKKLIPYGEITLGDSGYISYPHPKWNEDTILRLNKSGHEATVRKFIVLRDDFLAYFVYNTILSLIGTPRPSQIILKESGGKQTTTVDWGRIPLKPVKTAKSQASNAPPLYRLAHLCDGCKQPENDGARFSVCKNCNNKVSRKVYYCSRTCQISYWPEHKKVCGKQLDNTIIQNPTLRTPASLADDVFLLRRIGPARDGYVRSPALLRQIQYLDIAPFRDYAFFSLTGPKPVAVLAFIPRLVYRLTIQTAMCTGDSRCVAGICQVALNSGAYGDEFMQQIIAEYGYSAKAGFEFAHATRNEWSLVGQWDHEFLMSELGSKFRGLVGQEFDTVSPDVIREVVTNLREWWPRRS
ncbi:MYND-type domain-containing protein [Favolaschia claudopus]|uniref:MYND-type domain-containing protein n=1 Tax=Favolaschia claudopus TaxID=2862362 RepID=A0AAW0CE91_9AGAR